MKGQYKLRLYDNKNGSQGLSLVRIEGDKEEKICALDMTDIEYQCQAMRVAFEAFKSMTENIQLAGLSIDKQQYESAEKALQEYRKIITTEMSKTWCIIRDLKEDNSYGGLVLQPQEDTPF